MKFVKVDPKGKHFSFNDLIPHQNIPVLAVVAMHHMHGLEKVLNILMRMESDKVGAQHTADYFFFPWLVQQPKYLERRKWDVKKKSDGRIRKSLAYQARKLH